jgi:hypothetical protein
MFYPVPQAMAFNDSLLGLALLAAPVGHLTGNWVLARNVLVLLGFFLSAWWTYRLALRLGAHPAGAWLAGLLYGFCSFRFHHLTNVKLVFGAFIPLFFLHWTEFVQKGRASALAMAVGIGALQLVSSFYYGFFLLTLAPLYGLVLAGTELRTWAPARPGAWAATAGFIGIVALTLSLGFLLPYWMTGYVFGLQRSLEENTVWSATPIRYLVSQSRLGFLWTARWWNAEQVLWPGVLSLLAVLALPGRVPYATALWSLTGTAFLLSLGPRTPLFRWAYRVLPYFPAMRYPARWGALVILGLALLAALGVSRAWVRMKPRFRYVALSVLTFVAGLDLWHAPLPAMPFPKPPPIYRRLQHEMAPGAVAVFPLYSNFREGSTFYAAWIPAHGKPVIGAYAAWAPPSSEWMRIVLAEFPSPSALWLAQRLDIRYFVFHPASFRRVGAENLWQYYRQAIETLPAGWVHRRVQELEDVLLVLNLERIRRDLDVRPPDRWNWASLHPEQVQAPASPDARQAITDGDPTTAWVTRYTEGWHVTVDFGQDISLQAVRVFTDPKDKILYLWGSSDGSTWRPVYTVPWWVWAGARLLPDGRVYPDPSHGKDRPVLLCAPNRIRYLKLTSSPMAGHIAVRELQVILVQKETE